MNKLTLPLAAMALPSLLAAQTTSNPPMLSEAEEISMAYSAAPANVSSDATIYVLRNGSYEVAVEGTNGVGCMVSRSLPLSLEPICYDPEGARTVLPIEQRRVELRLAGLESDRIDTNIDAAIESGELAIPSRPAMAYMMSSRQVLYANAETPVGSWHPHIHIYMPYATAEQFGLYGAPSTEPGMVNEPGEPLANLMIVVRNFTAEE